MAIKRLGPVSAYAIAVEHGYRGTEEEWLATLKGERGERGEKGTKGDAYIITEEDKTEIAAEVEEKYTADLGELKQDLANVSESIAEISDIVFVESETHEAVKVSDIENVIKMQNYNASTNSSGVALNELDGYDSYYFVADKELDIYVQQITVSYYSICIGRNYTESTPHSGYIQLESSDAVRYRNTQSNLPTESNKLHINSGDVIAFTFNSNAVDKVSGLTVRKKESNVNPLFSGTVSLLNSEMNILMGNAHYVFKKVTDSSINVDTWRLYKGDLIKPNGEYFEMWSGSDAEGVVQIKDEQDFIGGYHGDEILTNIRIFVDGKEINPLTTLEKTYFKELSIYVESDVYHCNTSSLASFVAFKRNKYIKFSNGIVKVGNEWTAQSDLIVNSAPLSLFQCFFKENNEEIAKSYMVDSDYKIYDLATPSIHTPNNKEMSVFRLETKYGIIEFKNKKTSGQKPMGVVAYNFITLQNRIKFYYYTIYGDTQISSGDKLVSEFEFSVI